MLGSMIAYVGIGAFQPGHTANLISTGEFSRVKHCSCV